LLPFFDAPFGGSFHPFHCYSVPPAPTWRRPFHSCGVPYPQAPTLDRDSVTATIAEFMHVGPHPRWLNGTLGMSHSSAPFRNRSETFDTASPSQGHEHTKVPPGFLSESPTEARREGPSADCDLKAVRNDCLTRRKSIRPCVPSHLAYEVGAARQQTVRSPRTMYPHSQEWHRNREATVYLPA
jgi:hypothetical protein